MKLVIGVGALILLFSIPAHAQSYGNDVGSGGALNTGSSLNAGGGLGSVSFHSLPSIPETRFHVVVVSGSADEFIPSTYVSFQQAVEMGRALEPAKPKSLAEVAVEYRNKKKAKVELARSQGAGGQGVKQLQ